MNNWKTHILKNVIEFNPRESIQKGTIVVKIPMGSLDEWQRKVQSFEYSPYSSGPKFRNRDTIMAKITPCLENGKTAYVDILDDNEVAFGSSEYIVLRETEHTDAEFIYYLARSPIFRKRAISCMEGTSGRKRVNENTLKHFSLPFPELLEQKKIAKILSDLDAKIELNNQINKELEVMAKLVYDYWFVQFDFPDYNGKPYKSSGGKMTYNEVLKREIPEGWADGILSDIADIMMGQSPSGSSYNENANGIVFYQGSTDFGWRFPTVRQYTTEPKRMAKEDDILLSVRAPVGTLNQAMESCCIGRGLAALREKDGSKSYLWSLMEYFKQIFDKRNSSGTTFGSITKNDLFTLKVQIPDAQLIVAFKGIVDPLHQKIKINCKENQELASLRDWLLPMLMNGQVSVSEGYTIVEEKLGMVAEGEGKYEEG